jgi:lysophospholipase L1-like esterase
MQTDKKKPRTRILLRKKIVFSGVILLVFIAGLELLCFLARPLYTNVPARVDELEGLYLPDSAHVNLPESIHHNIVANDLLIPDEELFFRVQPNPRDAVVHGYTGINAQGYRGEAYIDNAEVEAATRIMIMGDSCAFGWAIHDYDSTFQAVTEHRLREREQPYRVYNFGQPAYSTTQGQVLFERWFPVINPDYIVLYFGWNDIWPTPMLTDRQYLDLLRSLQNPLVRQLRKSNAYQALEALFHSRIDTSATRGGIESRRNRVPVDEAIENYGRIVSAARANNVDVIVILPPFSNEGESDLYGIIGYNDRIRAALGDQVTVLSLDDMAHSSAQASTFYVEDGFHPNEKGAEYIATKLLEQIRALKN